MRKATQVFAKCVVRLRQKLKGWYEKIYVHHLRGEFKRLGSHAIIETPSNFMNPQCMSIGDHFIARSGVKLRAYTTYDESRFTPEITIGDHVHLAADSTINCLIRIEIGDYSGIGVGSKLMDHAHGLPGYEDLEVPVMKRMMTSKGGIRIGRNVMVGTGVVIMAGVEIGDNAVIGANSVVTKSIPANCIAAGAPARVIKTLDAREGRRS